MDILFFNVNEEPVCRHPLPHFTETLLQTRSLLYFSRRFQKKAQYITEFVLSLYHIICYDCYYYCDLSTRC
jgi:hypothetical protein